MVEVAIKPKDDTSNEPEPAAPAAQAEEGAPPPELAEPPEDDDNFGIAADGSVDPEHQVPVEDEPDADKTPDPEGAPDAEDGDTPAGDDGEPAPEASDDGAGDVTLELDDEGNFTSPVLGKYKTLGSLINALTHAETFIEQEHGKRASAKVSKFATEVADLVSQGDQDGALKLIQKQVADGKKKSLDDAVDMNRNPDEWFQQKLQKHLVVAADQNRAKGVYHANLAKTYGDDIVNSAEGIAAREVLRRMFFGYTDPETGDEVAPKGNVEELLIRAQRETNRMMAKKPGGTKPRAPKPSVSDPRDGGREPAPPSPKIATEDEERMELEAQLDGLD